MTTSPAISLSDRDWAVLRAVAAGRCRFATVTCRALTVDGLCCCDQFGVCRLTSAGLIAEPCTGPAKLTATGAALLAEAA